MSESELLKRISELEAENLVLTAENKQLRELLGLHSEKTLALQSAIESVNYNEKENNKTPTIIPIIDKYSSPEEKKALNARGSRMAHYQNLYRSC
jgi:regulator of replication initiation timing